MADDLRVGIRLTADGKGFVGELRVARKELDRFGQGASKAQRGLDHADRAARNAERGIRGLSKRLNDAHGRTIRYAASLLGAGGLAIGLRSFACGVVDAGLQMEAWESRLGAGGVEQQLADGAQRRLQALAAPPQFGEGARRLAVVDLDVESHVLVFRLPPGRPGNPLSR